MFVRPPRRSGARGFETAVGVESVQFRSKVLRKYFVHSLALVSVSGEWRVPGWRLRDRVPRDWPHSSRGPDLAPIAHVQK